MNPTTIRTGGRTARSIAAIALVAALASGCQLGIGGDDAEKPADGQTQSDTGGENGGENGAAASDGGTDQGTGAGEPAASDGGGDAVVDDDTQAAGVDPSSLGDPIASAEAPAIVDGDPEATMTVNLYSLTRSGETVVAVYSFQVHSTQTDHEDWLYGYLGDQGWHPYLIDTTNLNRHDVMTGAGSAQTAYQGAEFRPGQTFYAYAVFAAPPADVTTMDASIADGVPMATEVPLR